MSDATRGGIPQAPDFIVVGGRYKDKVLLLASKRLSYVELQDKFECLNRYDDMHPPRREIRLTAEMRDYIQVWEDSYPQAWQMLFERWAPEPESQQELPAVKELP